MDSGINFDLCNVSICSISSNFQLKEIWKRNGKNFYLMKFGKKEGTLRILEAYYFTSFALIFLFTLISDSLN